MKILFLGDIVGPSGCMVVKKYLKKIVKENKINLRNLLKTKLLVIHLYERDFSFKTKFYEFVKLF